MQLLAVVAFFVLLEGVLFLCGVQPLDAESDPYVGFAGHAPLFVEAAGDDGRSVLRTAPGKLKWFNAQEFPREKPAGTVRIVTLGGSTVYGHPFDDRASFSGWLRELLPAADPRHGWEVLNCGGISYASYREVLVLQEMLAYDPDLVIVYSGPNEFLEQRTYAGLAETSPLLLRLGSWAGHTRIFSLLRTLLHRGSAGESAAPHAAGSGTAGARTELAAEVDTLLERPAGLALYHRDDALRASVLEHFRFNLLRMVELCAAAEVRLLFVTPASQLRDCAPFKSEHGGTLSPAEIAAVERLLQEARAARTAGDLPRALALLEDAAARDPRHAETLYRLGEAQFAAGRTSEARVTLERARDEDVCPLRPLTGMRDIVREAAQAAGAPALDFVALVDAECERRFGHRVPGREQFLDHVHLDADGYRLLGLALLDRLVADGLVQPAPGWGAAALADVDARMAGRLDAQARGFALRNLAKTLGWAGKREEAERLAHQTLEALGDGDSESHFLLGNFAAQEGRYAEAIAAYRRAVAIDPDYAEAHLNLADALLKAGHGEQALAPLERTLALDPQQAQAWNISGLLLDAEGRYDEALARFGRALELAPDDARIHNNRALTLAHLQRLDEAALSLERALALDPGHAQAHYNLGLLRLRAGRAEEAAALFERTLALAPDYPRAREQLQAARSARQTGPP